MCVCISFHTDAETGILNTRSSDGYAHPAYCSYLTTCSSFQPLDSFPYKSNSSTFTLPPFLSWIHPFQNLNLIDCFYFWLVRSFHYYHEKKNWCELFMKKKRGLLFAFSAIQHQGSTGSDQVRISWWTEEGNGRRQCWILGSRFLLGSRVNWRGVLFVHL